MTTEGIKWYRLLLLLKVRVHSTLIESSERKLSSKALLSAVIILSEPGLPLPCPAKLKS
jgi:hypothetical protein